MRGINRVQLAGALGQDAELIQTSDGAKLHLRLATNETYKDPSGNEQTWTEWHSVWVKGHRAEKLAFLKKGQKVFIDGVLRTRAWVCEEGKTHPATEIVLVDLMITSKDEPKEMK